MDWITQPETWIAFFTLVALELILGVDNVIFISILAGKLPSDQQGRAVARELCWRLLPGSCCCFIALDHRSRRTIV